MSRIRTNVITNRMANGAPTVSNGLVISGVTTTSDIRVGTGATLNVYGGATFSGIVTAQKFVGDGSELNGVSGLGTALSNVSTSPLNKLYYVNSILSIDSNTIVDPPSTAVAVYTNYSELRIEESVDLTIESGDLVPDVLDLFVS